MKLQIISEKNEKLTELVQKLNLEIKRFGRAELQGLVTDADKTLDLINRGSRSRTLIFNDRRFLDEFLVQWKLLDERGRNRVLDTVINEITEKVNRMKESGGGATTEEFYISQLTLAEGVGGFLMKLAKWALVITQLLMAVGGIKGGMRGGVNDDNLYILNPYIMFKLTKGLYEASRLKP